MSSPFLQALSRILFWTYPRGGWQYDILSALILAFIFLTPPSVFDGSLFDSEQSSSAASGSEEGVRTGAMSVGAAGMAIPRR